MKFYIIALAVTSVATVNIATPAASQVVIYNDQTQSDYDNQGEAEANFLHQWNQRHDTAKRWGNQHDNFGPSDVIRLLERRGYSVRNVDDVGERFLVQASRGGDDLLVSVSRSGEIMGVVHDQH